MTKPTSLQQFQQQRARHTDLTNRRNRAEATRTAEMHQLDRARQECEQLFGTSDVAKLREMYREKEAENEQSVMELTLGLDTCERQLADIEKLTEQSN